MRRPLLLILPGILGGVLLETRLHLLSRLLSRPDAHRIFPFVLFGIYIGLLGLWGLFYRLRRQQPATCMLCLLAVVTGMSRYAIARYLPPDHITRLVDNDVVTLEGVLYRPVEISSGRSYNNAVPNEFLYVAVTRLERDGIGYRVRGNIRITLAGSELLREEKKSFSYGDIIRTRLRLKLPRNLPDFDYREYLRRQGIYLLGTLKHDRYIMKLSGWQGNSWLARMYAVRRRIVDFFTGYAADHPATLPTLQVLQAMTLGTSRQLSPEIRDVFRNSGLYHLLVVSGIHIGIVAAVLHYVLRMCYVPLRYRIVGIVPALLVYAGLSGFQYPVLRAVIMATVLYASVTLNRVADAVYSLGFAAMILVLMSPDAIFDLSFQMTIAATAAILLFHRCCMRIPWWKFLQKSSIFIKIPVTSILVSCGAMLGIAPLMIYHFQRLSPYSIISNLAAFLLVTPLLPLTLFTEFLALILPWNLVFPIFSLSVLLGKGLIWLSERFPPFPLIFPQFRPLALWIYYVGVFGGMTLFLRRKVSHVESETRL